MIIQKQGQLTMTIKNNILKKVNLIVMSSLVTFQVYAIQVVENSVTPVKEAGIADVVAGALVVGLSVGVFIGVIIFIIWFIVNKIQEKSRIHSDLLYGKFKIEIAKCHQNRDVRFKHRNWKTFFLSFKRKSIYLQTKEDGLKLFGMYDGELIIKDNFLLISVYRVSGIFSREKDIIIIPYELRTLVKKENHSKNWEMIISAESIDECLNTDYYAQLVIKNTKDDDKLINFNEYIQTNYMEKYIYRQVIKDNLLDYKTSIEKAVDTNPNINLERKNPKN